MTTYGTVARGDSAAAAGVKRVVGNTDPPGRSQPQEVAMRSLSSVPVWVAAAIALVLAGTPSGQAQATTMTFTSQPDWQTTVGGAANVTVFHFDGPTELNNRYSNDPLIVPSYSSQGVAFLPFLGTTVYPVIRRGQGYQIPDSSRDGLLCNESSPNPLSDLMGRAIRFDFNILTNAVGVFTNRWPLDNPRGDGGYLQALDSSLIVIGEVDLGAGIFGGMITEVPIARVNIVNTWDSDIKFGIWDLQFANTPVVTGVAVSAPARPGLAPPAPNPAVAGATVCWTLAAGGSARVTVSDVGGRLVRVLHEGWCEAGDTLARWDGRDAQGRACAAGLYFVRLAVGEAAGAQVLTQRLVVAR